jgi:hypothetical protein
MPVADSLGRARSTPTTTDDDDAIERDRGVRGRRGVRARRRGGHVDREDRVLLVFVDDEQWS